MAAKDSPLSVSCLVFLLPPKALNATTNLFQLIVSSTSIFITFFLSFLLNH